MREVVADEQDWRIKTISDLGPVASRVEQEAESMLARYVRRKRLATSTIRAYHSMLKTWIVPILGDLDVRDADEVHFQVLQDELNDRAPKYVNNVCGLLHLIVTQAARSAPAQVRAKIRVPSYEPIALDQVEVEHYSDEDCERLIAAARTLGPRQLATILLGCDAGLRASEMGGLHRASMIDGEIVIARARDWFRDRDVERTKTRRLRRVPMTDRLASVVAELDRTDVSPWLLYRDDGHAVHYSHLRNWVRAAQRAAGLNVTGKTHVLRHTFATRLVRAGVHVRVIQQLGGWSSLSQVERYTHVCGETRAGAIAQIGSGAESVDAGTAIAVLERDD